tara:strand:- start:2680 stop:3117 length:438 start_codon:yes stop_codon:yes gene_type:complete
MQIQEPITLEEAVKLLLHYVGITKLTKDNIKKVYLRSKQLQVLMSGGGFWEGRMPYLSELESFINFDADAPVTHNDKKWEMVMMSELTYIAKQWQKQEEEHLAKEEVVPPTINMKNDEAIEKIEEMIEEDKEENDSKEESEKYPY